jgi:hypothetical protein
MSDHFHRLAHSTTHEYFHSEAPNGWGVCFTNVEAQYHSNPEM